MEPTTLPERDPQWLRGVLPLMVLSILERGEAYGYDLARQLELAGVGVVKGGTLYPVLGRLEAAGMVDVHWSEPAAGPARKYYRLTAAGRRERQRGVSAWLDFVGRAGEVLGEVLEEMRDGTN